jgi:hypothetical protein
MISVITIKASFAVCLVFCGYQGKHMGFEGLPMEVEKEVFGKMVSEEKSFIQTILLSQDPNVKGSFSWANETDIIGRDRDNLGIISTDVKVRFCYPKTYFHKYVNEVLFANINYNDEKTNANSTTITISRVISNVDEVNHLCAFIEESVYSGNANEQAPQKGVMLISKYDYKQDKWLLASHKLLKITFE